VSKTGASRFGEATFLEGVDPRALSRRIGTFRTIFRAAFREKTEKRENEKSQEDVAKLSVSCVDASAVAPRNLSRVDLREPKGPSGHPRGHQLMRFYTMSVMSRCSVGTL
jgi:hypothetical protein